MWRNKADIARGLEDLTGGQHYEAVALALANKVLSMKNDDMVVTRMVCRLANDVSAPPTMRKVASDVVKSLGLNSLYGAE